MRGLYVGVICCGGVLNRGLLLGLKITKKLLTY